MRSGAVGLRLSLEHAVGAFDEIGDEAGLPGTPGGRTGRPAVGLGQGGQQVQGQPVADGLCDTGDGGGIVEIAPGGGVRQQEVLANEVDQDGDVGRSESHARGDAVDHLDADCGVIAREPLADVVQEGADEEEVRPFDGVGELGGQCGGLQEVTVDGVGVVGVALGLVADGRPLGDQPHQQTVLVEGLDLVDGGTAEAQAARRGRRASRPSMGRPAVACGRPGGAAIPWRWGGPTRLRWRPGARAARRRRRPGRATSRRSRRRPRPGRARDPPVSGVWRASDALRRKRRFGGGVGSHRRRRRQTSSLTQAICRPAVETASISASASTNPSAAATWSWSCRRSLSCSR